MLLFLGSSQISGGRVVGSGDGSGGVCRSPGSSRLPGASPWGLSLSELLLRLGEDPPRARLMSSELSPESPGVCHRDEKSRKKTQQASFPQSRERRPVNVDWGHGSPHATPLVLARKFSKVQHQEPAPPPPPLVVSRESQAWEGRGRGAN